MLLNKSKSNTLSKVSTGDWLTDLLIDSDWNSPTTPLYHQIYVRKSVAYTNVKFEHIIIIMY